MTAGSWSDANLAVDEGGGLEIALFNGNKAQGQKWRNSQCR